MPLQDASRSLANLRNIMCVLEPMPASTPLVPYQADIES